MAEENGNHGVSLEVMQRPLFQEHVGLVDQDNRIPFRGNREDLREVHIENIGFRPQISCSNNIERLSEVFG